MTARTKLDSGVLLIVYAYTPAIYRATWVIKTDYYVPFRFQGILKSETATEIVGTHHTSQEMLGGTLWSTVGSGPLSLAK